MKGFQRMFGTEVMGPNLMRHLVKVKTEIHKTKDNDEMVIKRSLPSG